MSGPSDILDARILIVDDQQANLRLIEYTLRRAGYADVASTTEPRDVRALHLREHYDLIILDLQMPHMNGFEVMTGLAGVGGAKKDVILVLSADPGEMVHSLEGGATGFLSKPFVLAELVLRVEQMLVAASARPVRKPEGRLASDAAARLRASR